MDIHGATGGLCLARAAQLQAALVFGFTDVVRTSGSESDKIEKCKILVVQVEYVERVE